MQRGVPAVFVQTKSHKADGLRVTMKFSNALKLARSPSPCFVLLLSRAEDGAEHWHAVHFWKELIGRALKRAREASRDGVPEDRFNKQSFSFAMKDADRRSADELLPWIARTVGAVGPDYAVAKQALHGGQDIVGMLSVGPLGSIDELVDHQLGLTPSIPMASVEFSLRRFGVDLPFPLPIPKGPTSFATIHSRPSATCDIRLRGPDGTVVEMTGEVIAPSLPNIPEGKRKVRIRARFFDIIWLSSGELQFKAHFDTRAKAPIAELEKMARFLSWSDQGEIDLKIWVDGNMILGAVSRLDPLEGREVYGAVADQAHFLTTLAADLRAEKPQIAMDDILDSEEADGLARFLATETLDMNLELVDGQEWHEIDHAIASGAGAYGDWIFAAIQRYPVLKQARDGANVKITLGKPVLLERYAFHRTNAERVERVTGDFRRYVGKPGVLGLENIVSKLG